MEGPCAETREMCQQEFLPSTWLTLGWLQGEALGYLPQKLSKVWVSFTAKVVLTVQYCKHVNLDEFIVHVSLILLTTHIL